MVERVASFKFNSLRLGLSVEALSMSNLVVGGHFRGDLSWRWSTTLLPTFSLASRGVEKARVNSCLDSGHLTRNYTHRPIRVSLNVSM